MDVLIKLLRRIRASSRRRNKILNRLACPVAPARLRDELAIDVAVLDRSLEQFEDWTRQFLPHLVNTFGTIRHKKCLELFFPSNCLNSHPMIVIRTRQGAFLLTQATSTRSEGSFRISTLMMNFRSWLNKASNSPRLRRAVFLCLVDPSTRFRVTIPLNIFRITSM